MKFFFVLIIFIVFSISNSFAQSKTEQDIDLAYQNAMKGIYWALSNIPSKKAKLDHELIGEDKLYSSIKLVKEINGVKIVATGFSESNRVEITIYKSYENLKSEGYNVPGTGWEGD